MAVGEADRHDERTPMLPRSRADALEAAARRKQLRELHGDNHRSASGIFLMLSLFAVASVTTVYYNTRTWRFPSVSDVAGALGGVETMDMAPEGVAGLGGLQTKDEELPSPVMSMSFQLEAWNKYTSVFGHAGKGYPFVAEGLMIEPHVATTLKVMNGNLSFPKLRWNLTQQTNLQSGQLTMINETDSFTREMEVFVTSVGTYSMELTGMDDTLNPMFVETTQFFCRYVRRSLRNLDEVDRTAFFDGVEVLMKTDDVAGQALFGPGYRSLSHFVKLHLANAADREVDHIHDGLGFLTQHIALTMEFEEALQLINPAITIPYWDFAEDKVKVSRTADPTKAIWELDIWNPDWFGNTSGSVHTVTEGRWAYQQIETNFNLTTEDSDITNAYGYLRAPWNMNKSPYLTRVHSFCGQQLEVNVHWPSCSSHFDWTFEDTYDSWYKYSWAAPYAPHATVHSMIGGYTNCGNVTEELKSFGVEMPHMEKAMDKLYLDTLTFVKNMYRAGLAQPPAYCSMDTPQTQCHMVCDEQINNMTFVHEFLSSQHVSWFGDWIESFPDQFLPDVMRVMCNTPWTAGEHMESASPADVSFWPVHPTLERLFHYKRMIHDFTDTAWENPSEHLPTKYCVYFYQSECKGHHATDLTTFKASYLDSNGDKQSDYVSNLDLFSMSNPHNYNLHYIYDGFTWDYCTEMTYKFPATQWATRG